MIYTQKSHVYDHLASKTDRQCDFQHLAIKQCIFSHIEMHVCLLNGDEKRNLQGKKIILVTV